MTDKTQNKVLTLVTDTKKDNRSDTVSSNVQENVSTNNKPKTPCNRGKPKSGRFWKTEKER